MRRPGGALARGGLAPPAAREKIGRDGAHPADEHAYERLLRKMPVERPPVDTLGLTHPFPRLSRLEVPSIRTVVHLKPHKDFAKLAWLTKLTLRD